MVIKHLFIFLLLFAKLNDKYSFGEDMLSWFYIHQICSIDLFHLYVKCRNEGVEAEGGGGGGGVSVQKSFGIRALTISNTISPTDHTTLHLYVGTQQISEWKAHSIAENQ